MRVTESLFRGKRDPRSCPVDHESLTSSYPDILFHRKLSGSSRSPAGAVDETEEWGLKAGSSRRKDRAEFFDEIAWFGSRCTDARSSRVSASRMRLRARGHRIAMFAFGDAYPLDDPADAEMSPHRRGELVRRGKRDREGQPAPFILA
jgi:hypothetical protein